MRTTMLSILSTAALTGSLRAQGAASLVDIPATKLELTGTRNLRGSSTILVPTVFLNVAIDGALVPVRQADAAEPVEYRFAVKGFDKAFLQGLAFRVLNDFVERLRDKGLIVLTYADLKDHAAVSGLGRLKTKADRMLPYRNDRFSPSNYLIATPSDEQAFKASNAGNAATFRELARELRGTVIVPEYWINAPQSWDEKTEGFKSAFKDANAAAGLDLYQAYFWMLNSDGVTASVRLKEAVSGIATSVGELSPGKTKPGRTTYQLSIDSAAYAAAVLRAGRSINRTAAEIIKATAKP